MGIVKKSNRVTTGNKNNVAQSFYQNIFYTTKDGVVSPFAFDIPQYTTIGGTKDYYGQDPLAIFTNLVLPFIRFNFTDNTSNFGPDVKIRHDFYRVSWDIYNTVQSGLHNYKNESIQSENTIEERIEEIDENGVSKIRTIKRSINEVNNIIKSSRKPTDRPSERDSRKIIIPTVADIQAQLDTPKFSITAETTGITTNIYDLQLDQFTKNFGEFETELFQSKDQYFIETSFIFNRTVTPGLTNLKVVNNTDEQFSVINETYQSTIKSETSTSRETINNGEFKGLTFPSGTFFSFFQVPDKPEFEYPIKTGQINTFTPAIYWSNTEKADSYMVQVNYNTGDTGFTGTVYTYVIPKTDEFKKQMKNKTKDTTSESETDKEIRTYQLSLKSNSCVLYRVGNVYELNNLFGVNQKVVTFSDTLSLCTQAEPIKAYVYTKNDSPYTAEQPSFKTSPSLESESPLAKHSLSGTVSGSIVSGATMKLTYSNTSFITTLTDAVGEFEFNNLEAGTYTLDTTYRGYATDTRQVIINSDTDLNLKIEILWDNNYDIWAIKENDIIKY